MHVDHIGLSVGDLEIAAVGLRGAFLLGPDDIALELLERQGSTRTRPDAVNPPDALLDRGWGHICFRVEDVDAVFAHLVELGATVVGVPGDAPEPGVRFAYVADPEGNLIELLDRKGPVSA